jgi:hypothetical protein
LTLDELKEIFNAYEIKIDLVALKNIIDKLDKDGGGTLDL